MNRYWVELSGENPALARAEVEGAIHALGGRVVAEVAPPPDASLVAIDLPTTSDAEALVDRLAFARRVHEPLEETSETGLVDAMARAGGDGATAAFRPLHHARGGAGATPQFDRLVRAYVRGGGSVDLERPARRYWVATTSDGHTRVTREVGAVDRVAAERRRMPRLPFRRPVSLPPRLARAAANLARIRPGDRVVDPFVGTGALLLEAALLGAHVSGGDRDPTMVRGALRNLSEFGQVPERLVVADAASPFPPADGGLWDAVLTDPPYGRSSGTGGEAAEALVARALPGWADLVRPGGRIVVILPGGPDPLPSPWRREVSIPDRVHRSLTREFRVYARDPEITGS